MVLLILCHLSFVKHVFSLFWIIMLALYVLFFCALNYCLYPCSSPKWMNSQHDVVMSLICYGVCAAISIDICAT